MTTLPDINDVQKAIHKPLDAWRHQCHDISLSIVKSGILDRPARVARGMCHGIPGQHSWIVLSDNPQACFDPDTLILDPTLWSYLPENISPTIDYLHAQRAADDPWKHTPHGMGHIFSYGMPHGCHGKHIALTPSAPLSSEAQGFLDVLCPERQYDIQFWSQLGHAPVDGWPAQEIITAMYQTPELQAIIPIDIVGMITNLNPHDLYF